MAPYLVVEVLTQTRDRYKRECLCDTTAVVCACMCECMRMFEAAHKTVDLLTTENCCKAEPLGNATALVSACMYVCEVLVTVYLIVESRPL